MSKLSEEEIKNIEDIYFEDLEILLIIGDKAIRGVEIAEELGIDNNNEYPTIISLEDINEYIEKDSEKHGCPIVINETPLRGTIYRLGNHKKGKWEKIGETCGYA